MNAWNRQGWLMLDDLIRLHDELSHNVGGRDTRYPLLNVWLGDDKLAVDLELPGVDPKDVDISIQENRLKVSGKREAPALAEDARYYKQERVFGNFNRTQDLPFAADATRVTATYRNGILRIEVPRAESDKPTKIKIEAA